MRRQRIIGFGIKAVLMSIYLLMIYLAYMADRECIYLKYLHIPCPGCGMSRAVISLFHLDFLSAVRYHPMVFSIPVLAVYILADGRPFKRKWVNNIILIFIGVGFFINYIVKLLAVF